MADVNTVSTETSGELLNSEKRTSKSNVHIRRSSNFPGLGSGMSASMAAARLRRQSTRYSIPRAGFERRLIRYENTYRMEPDADHKIDFDQLRRVTTDIIDKAMSGYKYDSIRVKKFSLGLAERIRNEVKQFSHTRYKSIIQVIVGQRKGQGLLVASRCLWDSQLDRHITISKQIANAFVTVTIFLVYNE